MSNYNSCYPTCIWTPANLKLGAKRIHVVDKCDKYFIYQSDEDTCNIILVSIIGNLLKRSVLNPSPMQEHLSDLAVELGSRWQHQTSQPRE